MPVSVMSAKRKGYFFTVDAFFAIAVIVGGLLIMYSAGSFSPSPSQTRIYSDEIMNILANTKLYEVNHPIIDQMAEQPQEQPYIVNMDYTLLEEIGELFYRYGLDCPTSEPCHRIDGFIQAMVGNALPPQFRFQLHIYALGSPPGTTVFPLELDYAAEQLASRIITTSRKVVSGVYEGNSGPEFWTYGVQVEVWQAEPG